MVRFLKAPIPRRHFFFFFAQNMDNKYPEIKPRSHAGLHWQAVLPLACGTFALGTDAFIVAAFLPDMAHDLRVSVGMAGQSVTAFALTYALLAPFIAAATARIARRRLMVVVLVALAAANLGSALAPDIAMLLATRVLAAAAAAGYTPTATAVAPLLADPGRRATAVSVVVGGLTVATALGVPMGHLINEHTSWRIALMAVAALCTVAAALIRISVPALEPAAPATTITIRSRAAVAAETVPITALTWLGMTASYVPYAYAVPILRALDLDAVQATAMLLAYGVGAFFGNVASGKLSDRIGPFRVLAIAYGGMAITLGFIGALAASAHGASPMLAALLFALWGATSWAQTPAQVHRLLSTAHGHAAFAVSINASAIYFGIGTGTALGAQLSGTPGMLAGVAAVIALGALALLALTRRR